MTSHSRDFRSRSNSGSFASPGGSYSMQRERSCSPSSRYGACSSPTMGVSTSRSNFSSSSLTGYSRCSYPTVSVNKRLLTPLHLDIDPSVQEIKTKEKDEIRTLNNQFAALIGKVQSLEQHNQVLLTRWNFLKEQDNSLTELDIKLLYDQYMNRLNLEVRSIDAEKEQLDSELDEVLDAMDSFRNKYEEEINKRTGMEFTFMTLKKDLDNGFLHKTELEAKLSGLLAVAELMKNIYEQELEEVLSQMKDISVVVGIDNNRYNPDPHRIVEDVRAQYEDLAIRSWEELEALTRSKLNEREVLSAKYGDHLLNDRRVIAELNIQIQKMRSCIVSLKSQCLRLEENIKEVGAQGESALNDAKAKLAKLEEALHSARQDLAHLVKEYQELMNIKLALDIEILTYRKLMEGEEFSMESPMPAVISRIYSTPKLSSSNTNLTTTSNMATTDSMNRSGSSLESGLSRSQSGGSRGFSTDVFSRNHSNRSGGPSEGISEASRSPSSIRKGTLESSPSRSSSRSGNFADIEDTMESNVSRSQGHGSGSYRNHSNRSGDNLEGSLSRSQSNRSAGLTDSVFTRTNSGTSEGVQEGSYSRSQSGDLADKVLTRTHSGESERVSGDSLSRSYSGTSASYVEGSLSRSQSNENESHGNYGSEALAEPSVYKMTSAEDGGVPVGGPSRSNSRASSYASGGSLSRNENDHSRGSEGYAEPIVSRTNSAEDGGVPVGGISRSHSGASSYASGGSLSRSHSDEKETHGTEGYAEPAVSRTNSAEDGGVPVGGVSRSSSKSSSQGGSFRSRSGDFVDTVFARARTEGAQEGSLSRCSSGTNAAFMESSVSRSHSGGSRGISEGSLSRSQSSNSERFVGGGLSRDHSSESKESHSDTSGRFVDGDSYASHCEAHEVVLESGLSRSTDAEANSFARSHSAESGGPVETSTPIWIHRRSEDIVEPSLSRSHSGDSGSFKGADFYRSSSEVSRGVSEASLSRSSSKENENIPEGAVSRSYSYRCAVISHPNLSRTESEDASESSLSRSLSSEKENAPEVGLSRSYSGRSEEAPADNLCTSHSGGHESFPESGPFVEEALSRSQNDEPAIGIPVCMVYEFSTDEHHHLPAGEVCYYVESGSME